MHDPRSADLAKEAERYLALVELFRAEGYEPQWRREPTPAMHDGHAGARGSTPAWGRQA